MSSLNTAYENEHYQVLPLEEKAEFQKQTLNWAVINKQYGGTEHKSASLPQAIEVATMFNNMLNSVFETETVGNA